MGSEDGDEAGGSSDERWREPPSGTLWRDAGRAALRRMNANADFAPPLAHAAAEGRDDDRDGVARPAAAETEASGEAGANALAETMERILGPRPAEGSLWSFRLIDYLSPQGQRNFPPESVAHAEVQMPRTYFELRMRSVMLQVMALEAVNKALVDTGFRAEDSLAAALRRARHEGIVTEREYVFLKHVVNAEGNASKHRRLNPDPPFGIHDRL